ncbi:hypothetical protein F4823DRAFT_629668 [Ustulina deusta]|nr:hypothetical protein F4823DRAFT_629668 [Ustulina deusta]
MAATPSQPSSESDATLGVGGLVIALAVVSVALRFYTRIFTRQGLQWDDWLILVAVITTLATAALLLWNTDPNYVYTAQDVTISSWLSVPLVFHVSSAFRYQLFSSAGLVVGWWVGCTVATLTNCIPLEWSWINSLADPRYCFNYNIFWMASGACEIFLDALILTLPISVVIRLQFSLKQKLTVSGIFLLGGFVVITGIIKVVLGYPQGSRVPSYSNTEVWTTVHTGIAIVCSSLPILNPLLNHILKSSFTPSALQFCWHTGKRKQESKYYGECRKEPV